MPSTTQEEEELVEELVEERDTDIYVGSSHGDCNEEDDSKHSKRSIH